MADNTDRVRELEKDVERLMHEVDRYRTATEDALQQVDWCIGYFTGCNKPRIARSLGQNRAYIRRNLLHRPELDMPADASGNAQ